MNVCPNDAPVELADGTRINPEDVIRLKDLCEIVPLILETMQAAAEGAPGAPGPRGQVTPGAPVPVVGRGPGQGFSSPVAPGFGSKPGSIAPAAPGQGRGAGGGGGGGGFGGGGGGGRGAPGPVGPPGPAGPAGAPGLGNVLGGTTKRSGSFTVTGAPQVIPDFFANFTVSRQGNVTIRVSANFHRFPGSTFPQVTLGVQIDGQGQEPLALFQEQQGAGDDQVFDAHIMAELFIPDMAPGTYTVRGIYSGGFPGAEMTFVAEPTMPAVMVVQGP